MAAYDTIETAEASRPVLDWHFAAVVSVAHGNANESAAVVKRVCQIFARVDAPGSDEKLLQVAVCAPSKASVGMAKAVVLLRARDSAVRPMMQHELERRYRSGTGCYNYDSESEHESSWTRAELIQTIARLLEQPRSQSGGGLVHLERRAQTVPMGTLDEDPDELKESYQHLDDVFPLKDREWAEDMVSYGWRHFSQCMCGALTCRRRDKPRESVPGVVETREAREKMKQSRHEHGARGCFGRHEMGDTTETELTGLHYHHPGDSSLQLWWDMHHLYVDDEFLDGLREHFGDRVAVYFAFHNSTITHLVPLGLFGFVLFLVNILIDHDYYLRLLAVFALGVSCVWAPIFITQWDRKEAHLMERWGWKGTHPTTRVNPYYEEDRQCAFLHVILAKVFKSVVVISLVAAVFAAFSVFVYWHVWARMQPTCSTCCCGNQVIAAARGSADFSDANPSSVSIADTCRSGLHTAVRQDTAAHEALDRQEKDWYTQERWEQCIETSMLLEENGTKACRAHHLAGCFVAPQPIVTTDRWFYIFGQGLCLAICLAILQALFFTLAGVFTKLENFKLEINHHRATVQTTWVLVWVVNFSWAILVGFLFIPFGDQAVSILAGIFGEAFEPGGKFFFRWEPGIMTMDTLFLDPLVILNILNLFINTCGAHLVRSCCDKYKFHRFRHQEQNKGWQKDFSKALESVPDGNTVLPAVMNYNDLYRNKSSIRGSNVGTDQGHDGGPTNEDNAGMAVDAILMEAELPQSDNTIDYLNSLVRFSFLVMYSATWPFVPILLLFNTWIERPIDLSRCLRYERNPVFSDPYMGPGALAAWRDVLVWLVVVGHFFTSVLIVVSTGQLESWVQAFDGCTGNRDLHGIMAPDWTCLPRLSWRLAAFYVLEHGGLLVIVQILSASGVPEIVTTRHRRHHAKERTRSLKKQ